MKLFPKLKLNVTLLKLAYHFIDVEASGKTALPDAHSVEYPFIISKLNVLAKGKVLEVGCTARSNCLPAILAWQGWDVYGIDLRQFNLKHPNFHFVRGDITETSFPDNYFDYVYEISVLEHIGRSGRYGVETEDIEGDMRAVREITRILRPGGTFFVIEAFGQQDKVLKSIGRIYNKERLNKLLSNYNVMEQVYYCQDKEGYWNKVFEEEAADIGSKKYNEAIIMIELCLKK